jgi:hypothetical protein
VRAHLLILLVACGGRASDPPDAGNGSAAPGPEYPVKDPSFGDGGPVRDCACPATGYVIEAELGTEKIRLTAPSDALSLEPFCKATVPSCSVAQSWKTHYRVSFAACATDRKACAIFHYHTNPNEPVPDEGHLILGDRKIGLSKLVTDKDPRTFAEDGTFVATFTGLAGTEPITLRASVCRAKVVLLPF